VTPSECIGRIRGSWQARQVRRLSLALDAFSLWSAWPATRGADTVRDQREAGRLAGKTEGQLDRELGPERPDPMLSVHRVGP
jgi:hypothetical protein